MKRSCCAAVAALWALVAMVVHGRTQTEVAYVHASRVAVRAQPLAAAAVAGYVTTNTRVEVEERAGDWCRVRSASLVHAGFVACRFLADAPLTLDAVASKLADATLSPRAELDWESRGFWIAPSLVRFELVGERMEDALPTQAHRSNEMQVARPSRFPNAEFDAMKARLAAGVVPDGRDYTPRVIEGLDRYSEALRLARKRVPLPNVTPSFFHSGEPLIVVALRPFVLEQQGDIAIGLADALGGAPGAVPRARPAARMLLESADAVREAVRSRIEAGRELDLNYGHPLLLIQLLLWHEGYHHGQIKLALKLAGHPISDEEAGPSTWHVWRRRA
jgi:hypothetical protein